MSAIDEDKSLALESLAMKRTTGQRDAKPFAFE